MGYYINPTEEGVTKEKWLADHASPRSAEVADHIPATIDEFGPDLIPVVWVHNGNFTAAAIAYNNRELRRFSVPDERPKMWLLVPRSDLYAVSDLARVWPPDRAAPYTEAELEAILEAEERDEIEAYQS